MSRAGEGRRPWTDEDAARLAGTFRIGGRAMKPHVATPAGPYFIGSVLLWCMRVRGQRKDGTPIICARRKSKASDATCSICARAA